MGGGPRPSGGEGSGPGPGAGHRLHGEEAGEGDPEEDEEEGDVEEADEWAARAQRVHRQEWPKVVVQKGGDETLNLKLESDFFRGEAKSGSLLESYKSKKEDNFQ